VSSAAGLSQHEVLTSVSTVWERLLGIPAAPEDDFFELGGYSMLAMEMCQTLREQGFDVAVIDLVRNSRLDAFVDVLTGRWDREPAAAGPGRTDFESLWSAARSPYAGSPGLTELSAGTGPGVYVVHWGTGNIAFLGEYAAAMSGRLPLVGIANPGHADRVRPLLSVGDLAWQYAQQVLDRGPQDSVLLAGLCSGGYIAIEMARYLRQAGVRVPLVGFVNTMPPGEPVGFEAGTGLGELYESRLAYLKTRFRLTDLDAALDDLLGELTARDVSYHDRGTTPGQFHWLQAVWAGLTFAQVHYEPRPYDGPVHIFQVAQEARHFPDGWASYVPAAQASTYDASSTLPIIQHPHFAPQFRAVFERAADG